MTIKRFFDRFNQLYSTYIAKDGRQNPFAKVWYLTDYFFSYIFQGASLNDYFAYCFYKLRPCGRREYITYRRYHRIMSICNDPGDIKYFRDKSEFNRVFKACLGRENIDLNLATPEEFRAFFEMYKEIFVKEVRGFRGNSVKLYSLKDVNPDKLYADLKSESGRHYVAENRLREHPALSAFHPASINTLRLVTVYDDKKDQVHIMSARIRIGNKGNYVDNFHFEGIGANIDIDSGIICSVGYNARDEEFLVHPMTGKQIMGFQVPDWQECKAFVEQCARVVKTVRYVGWDVVPQENGGFALIEGNDNADHDFQQMHYHGMWPEYKELLAHRQTSVDNFFVCS